MFEVTGDDITNLTDTQLRTLVARLAIAELYAQGCPVSSVTAGGDQDAKDGGIDVRVDCPVDLKNPDFVRRKVTVYQVKKSDMPARLICKEMSPRNELRPIFGELANVNGAYIIVSAKGSVADSSLKERRKAIEKQLRGLPNAEKLHTDFYDRERLANWVNLYPGIVAWVDDQRRNSRYGWASIGNWLGTNVSKYTPYLSDDKARIIDERTSRHEQLNINEGIVRLREILAKPGKCVRLIGLSGLGKTRLVQALFEGECAPPLDPSIAVYTDYSQKPFPTARDMARHLISTRRRAILIVDNCNPATHSELANICSETGSQVSLITVEYDVRCDEPEGTDVFRIQSASADLVAQWLLQNFPDVTYINCQKIAEFSDGNFRLSRALAETLSRGQNLGTLKSYNLFERLFLQRNEPDQTLLLAAENLALLYSINGKNLSKKGELAQIAKHCNLSIQMLFKTLQVLHDRGLVQSRGRWRAILPQALSNWLATSALKRITPRDFDSFFVRLPSRMKKSLSRRLGYLHDSDYARTTFKRWLKTDSILGNLPDMDGDTIQILANIAPIDPKGVLKKIKCEISKVAGQKLINPESNTRKQWICLIKQLAYDADMFDEAATVLAQFFAAEPLNYIGDSACSDFTRLFRLRFSSTRASPEQRRTLIEKWAQSEDCRFQNCASAALDSMLDTREILYFNKFDFGARSRDWGWMPLRRDNADDKDACSWYEHAIKLVGELSSFLPNARDILASHVRELWHIPTCRNAIEQVATQLSTQFLWIEGWGELSGLLSSAGPSMSDDVTGRLKTLVEQLEPKEAIHQEYAFLFIRSWHRDVINNTYDKTDEFFEEKSKNIGRNLADDPTKRHIFISKILNLEHPSYVWQLGCGIAEKTADLSMMWKELIEKYNSTSWRSNLITLLCGFIYGSQTRDVRFTSEILEQILTNKDLVLALPRFQSAAGINDTGIARLRRAINKGVLSTSALLSIAYPGVATSSPIALTILLRDIAKLDEGVECALYILNSHFKREEGDQGLFSQESIKMGRWLLRRANLAFVNQLIDMGISRNNLYFSETKDHNIIYICCGDTNGEATLRNICRRARAELKRRTLSIVNLDYLLKSLFEINAHIALDEFLTPDKRYRKKSIFEKYYGYPSPIEVIPWWILMKWAKIDPEKRFLLLGREMSMFHSGSQRVNQINRDFYKILIHAPRKDLFLGDIVSRVRLHSTSDTRIKLLHQRKEAIQKFADKVGGEVMQWVEDGLPRLNKWIDKKLEQDRKSEQSFE